jgi:hypothetical protein
MITQVWFTYIIVVIWKELHWLKKMTDLFIAKFLISLKAAKVIKISIAYHVSRNNIKSLIFQAAEISRPF